MKMSTKQFVGVTACALFLAGCQAEAQSSEEVAVRGTSLEAQATVQEEAHFISLEEAKAIAFDHAEVDGETVHFDEAELDESDRHYELEFKVEGNEFEYAIDALTGEILKAERDEDAGTNKKSKDTNRLSLDDALTAALLHADVERQAITIQEIDWDDDDEVIELEFYTKDVAFEYDIHASTGAIIEAEQENRDSAQSDKAAADKQPVAEKPDNTKSTEKTEVAKGTQQNTSVKANQKTKPSSAYIGLEKAKEIALTHAGESLSSVHFDDQELDKDDQLYELEFSSDDTEYEYDIHAVSGEILSVEKEKETKEKAKQESEQPREKQVEKRESRTPANKSKEKSKETVKAEPALLTKEQAIAAALKHAGLSRNQVEFDDVERESDDGRVIWEIEFESGSYEFEYEIDAEIGSILDYEKEYDD